jgi:hypothetical protein
LRRVFCAGPTLEKAATWFTLSACVSKPVAVAPPGNVGLAGKLTDAGSMRLLSLAPTVSTFFAEPGAPTRLGASFPAENTTSIGTGKPRRNRLTLDLLGRCKELRHSHYARR